jgi:hypothetical protein
LHNSLFSLMGCLWDFKFRLLNYWVNTMIYWWSVQESSNNICDITWRSVLFCGWEMVYWCNFVPANMQSPERSLTGTQRHQTNFWHMYTHLTPPIATTNQRYLQRVHVFGP